MNIDCPTDRHVLTLSDTQTLGITWRTSLGWWIRIITFMEVQSRLELAGVHNLLSSFILRGLDTVRFRCRGVVSLGENKN